MTGLLAYPVALGAALPTTLAVLALWIAHARIVRGDRADTVFLPLVFLFVPLIFFVAVASNVAAVTLAQLVALVVPGAAATVAIGGAGVLVLCFCAWTQRGTSLPARAAAPVSLGPVLLFAAADMLILAGGLSLLPASSNF